MSFCSVTWQNWPLNEASFSLSPSPSLWCLPSRPLRVSSDNRASSVVWNQRGEHSFAQAPNEDLNSCRNNPDSRRECKPIRCLEVAAPIQGDNQRLCEAKLMPAGPTRSPSVWSSCWADQDGHHILITFTGILELHAFGRKREMDLMAWEKSASVWEYLGNKKDSSAAER